jgi:hypothetical protein
MSAKAAKVAEVEGKLAGFKRRAEAERERFDTLTDSAFWVALCFESRAQKLEFLEAMKSRGLSGEDGESYVDGLALAKAVGVNLASPRVSWPKERAQLPEEEPPPPRLDA